MSMTQDYSLADILFPRITPDEGRPEYAPLGIGLKNRTSHTHIVGSTGSGKTQLIQYMIHRDLEEDCCVVVIDNQRQMIPKLAALGYDMQYITPRYPLALNIFDFPNGNHAASLLQYVLAAIMEAPLTPKQEVIFQFAVTLVLALKGNINTFQEILQGGEFDLSGVDPTTRRFFQTEFYSRQYEGTRQEIGWRIWSLLKNPALRDMFGAKENRCSLELDRKLILIDTDVDLLQNYSGMFGRFFLAQLLQAAQHRFQGKHKPVYVYLDECYFYLDESVVSMLETARKANMGLILAHQYLGQITEPKVSSALMSLTSTKFAAQLSPSDTHVMAQAMGTDPDFINKTRKLHFVLWQRGRNLSRRSGSTYQATYRTDPIEIVSTSPLSNNPTVRIKVPTGVIESQEKYPIPNDEMIRRYGRRNIVEPELQSSPSEPGSIGQVDEESDW